MESSRVLHGLWQSADELFYRQLGEISGLVALLLGDFNFPDITWEHPTALMRRSGKFLKLVEENFLSQVLREPPRKDSFLGLSVVNGEGQVMVGDCLGCSEVWLCRKTYMLRRNKRPKLN